MHRLTGILGLILAVAALAAPAAEVYKWTDGQGRVHYGDRPQSGSRKVVVTPGSGLGNPEQKRATPSAPDPAVQAAQCERKRKDIETYRNALAVMERGPNGEERELTPEQRDKLIASAEKRVNELCGPAAEG
ncbi:MAG TPA: DUF4124 domain-containing protein [Solimonas sp.]|nr:DUF4124 domain-containing protein [Solimonas sp.]